MLEGVEAKQKERHWTKNQLFGDFDDKKTVYFNNDYNNAFRLKQSRAKNRYLREGLIKIPNLEHKRNQRDSYSQW